jgi:hypothetical protein
MTIHAHLGYDRLRNAQERFREVVDEAGIHDLRVAAVLDAVAKVLEEQRPATGLPVRSDVNRNASLHRVERPQYRPVNALSGMMLVVSLLLELQEIAREAGDVEDEESAVER